MKDFIELFLVGIGVWITIIGLSLSIIIPVIKTKYMKKHI